MFKQIFEIFKSDSLYEQALLECHEMLDIDLEMFNASIDSLRNANTVDIDIYSMDKKINEFERDVRRKVMTHLAIGGREDIGSGLILVSVVIDSVRIGDYTKNIYDLSQSYTQKLDGGEVEDQLKEVELHTKDLFIDTIDSFKNQDIDKARSIMHTYKDKISNQSDHILMEIVKNKYPDMNANKATAISLYSRYLKRVAAHSKNLISSIVNPFERIGYGEK